MAKVFIEQDTLTAIGNAIREKEGTTELIPVTDMSTRISTMQTGSDPVIEALEITNNGTYTATNCDGYSPITVNVPQDGSPPEEAFHITGDCSYRFAYGGWSWFIDTYGNKVTTSGITNAPYMFSQNAYIEKIPFVVNMSGSQLGSMFVGCRSLKQAPRIRGTLNMGVNLDLGNLFGQCECISDLEDTFEPEVFDDFSSIKLTSAYSVPKVQAMFSSCRCLRRLPSWWYKFKINEASTAFPAGSYSLYSNMLYGCNTLDEAKNIPAWRCQGTQTSNMFSSTFSSVGRLKGITFETNNGQPVEAKWKSQIIELQSYVGYSGYALTSYGFTADTEVKDDATYQALKNDPDWWTTKIEYSRYNHDSAVETINSLPDTSAYLASAGGTNTIKFKGQSGSATDGGAISTLTAEEIAVATAKGWTVTLS